MNGSPVDLTNLPAQLALVRGPIETALTLPPVCYSREELFQQERRSIFARVWVGVGPTGRWSEVGDYATMDIAGVPIIIVKATDGVLRAFANSCRHRSARLLDGEGQCKTIRCPFHRWTYALDGRLLNAPNMEAAKAFDTTDFGLTPVRIDSSDGLAFVCLDQDAVDLEDWLGDFSQKHVPWDLAGHIPTRRREFEVACNWKSFLEVFNEYYHLPYVHPNSLSSLYDPPDEPDAVSGNYATQFGTTGGTGGLMEDTQGYALPTNPALEGRNRHGVRYTWLFPNMTFAAGTDAVWLYEVYPLSAQRTQVAMTACFPASTVAQPNFDEVAAYYYQRLNDAIDEDIPALVNQQAGLNSPLARQGRFCPALEPSVARFAGWYAERVLEG